MRARVNKRGVPKSPALQQAEGKLSPLPYGSFASSPSFTSSGKAPPSKVCSSLEKSGCGELEGAVGMAELNLVLEDETP